MSKESPLSHHEQLRYDYLFKNIHYLNDREKREFDYLKRKWTVDFPLMKLKGKKSREGHWDSTVFQSKSLE